MNSNNDIRRAALAEPVPEGPSDEELTQFLFDRFRGPIEFICDAEEEAHVMIRNHIKFARAVLARWACPAAPPAPEPGELGEVEELVEWLTMLRNDSRGVATRYDDRLARIITLLSQQAAPAPVVVPVAVSKRLPGEGDCTTNPRTGQGQWCWGWVQHDPAPYSGRWRMMRREWLADEAVAWLPAHAIPLPQAGEAQP